MAEDGTGGISIRSDLINLNAYWKQQQFAYDSGGNIEYIGKHYDKELPTSDVNWSVWKFNYTGSDLTSISGPLNGAWDNRATLDW